MHQALRITGMHCGRCSEKVTQALLNVTGVSKATVTLPDRATIETAIPIALPVLAKALEPIGTYTVSDYRFDLLSRIRIFYPLITMFGIVMLWATVLASFSGHAFLHAWMQHFMGGFFLLFGGLKVLNLRNFAAMYRGYDLLAARVPIWGYIYPFIELALGITYTIGMGLAYAHIATIALMSFGALGIYRKIKNGAPQTCACLGGFFSVPLTWVTVAENLLMVGMAVAMLLQ